MKLIISREYETIWEEDVAAYLKSINPESFWEDWR